MPQFVPAKICERLDAGATNLDLMKTGNAPIGSDGYQLILHHFSDKHTADDLKIVENAPIIELEASEIPVEFKVFQKAVETQFRKDPTTSAQYCLFRMKHWAERAKELEQPPR